MDLIIAGSRSIKDCDIGEMLQESPFTVDTISTLLHGDAEGIDTLAKEYFKEKDTVSITSYPYEDFLDQAPNANVAPLIRNTKMAEEADALLAIWDGESNGTKDMIDKAKKEGLEIHIHRTDLTNLNNF